MPDRIIEASVDIDAPLETVWRVMTDFTDYARWNPFILRVEGPVSPGEGDVLTLHTRLPNARRARSEDQITVWQPPRAGHARLTYELVGPMSAGLRVERDQRLVAIDHYRCRYESRECFGGLLKGFLPMAQLEEATLRQGDALRWAAEGTFVGTTDGSVYPMSDREPSLPPLVF